MVASRSWAAPSGPGDGPTRRTRCQNGERPCAGSHCPGRKSNRWLRLDAHVRREIILALVLPFACGSQERPVGSIAIVEVGVTPVTTDGTAKATIWTQVENRGPAFGGTHVVFTVLTPDRQPVWSAWRADISWREGERKRLSVEWEPRDVPPGDYRVDVSVVSDALQTTIYSRADDAGVVHVRP